MMLRARVEPLPVSRDPRGLLIEPLGPVELPAQRNVHLVVTGPGQIRGNHFHRLGTEIVTVLGPALVRLREEGQLLMSPFPKSKPIVSCCRPVSPTPFKTPAPNRWSSSRSTARRTIPRARM
jgi:hypothetical protein